MFPLVPLDQSTLNTATTKAFFQLLQQQQNLIRDLKFAEPISARDTSFHAKNQRIEHCSFGNIEFPYINGDALTISNSEFNDLRFYAGSSNNLALEQCKIQQFYISGAYNNTSLIKIENCEITTLIVETTAKLRSIELLNTHIDKIQILSTVSTFSLNSCSGLTTAAPSHSRVPVRFVINQIQVSAGISTLNIINCYINTFKASITIKELILKKTSIFDSAEIQVATDLNIAQDCYIKLVQIKEYVTAITIAESSIDEFHHHGKSNSIKIEKSKSDPIRKSKFKTLDFSKTEAEAVDIQDFTTETLNLNNFKATGARLRFLEVTKTLMFEHSTMEDAYLHNVNLSTAEFKFLNSSLAKSTLSNVEWPARLYEFKKEIAVCKSKRDKLNYLFPLREAYRQLKYLCNNQLNHIDAIAFQKRELRAYWRLVHTKFGIRKDIENWLILWTNRLFSDFGQSWLLPLGWLLLVHLILFTVLLYNFDLGIEPSFSNIGWPATEKGIGMFFSLINPVHPSEIPKPFTAPPEKVSILGTTDFFIRVFSAYFIYYFLKGTRKFSITSN
jgi:hypothetical protein